MGGIAPKRNDPARLGILMLETRFPRLPGDIGNPLTFPFPVIYQVVTGASAERVVNRRASGLLDRFIAAAEELVRLGADGITTTCGFSRSISASWRGRSMFRSRPPL